MPVGSPVPTVKAKAIRPLREALIVSAGALLCGGLTLVSVVGLARSAVISEVTDGLARVANVAAGVVDGELHAELVEKSQWGGAAYERAIAPLRRVHRGAPDIAYVYTLRLLDGLPHFVLDTAPPGDRDEDGVEDHSYLLDPYPDADTAVYEAFASARPVVTPAPVTDRWGTFMSAYAPIFDGGGRLEAIIGVDLEVSSYHARLAGIERAGWSGGVGVLGIAMVIGVLVWNQQRGARRSIEESDALASAIRRAKEEAESASESKSRFLANVSHELRTPMTAIVGFGELLQEEGWSEEQRRAHAATIRRHADQLLGLINDLLDLSRLESGGMELAQVEYSAVDVVRAAVGALEPRAREAGLDLRIEWLSRVPAALRGDPDRLRQVLVNLIGNAIKFTPEGSVRVLVRYEPSPKPELHVAVEDTGIGIGAGHLAHVFEPFMQADASRSRRFGGTGLGLALCKCLVEAMGGDMQAESDGSHGSRFTVRIAAGCLPDAALFDAQSLITPPRAPTARGARGEGVRLSGRVLVAEDGRDNQVLVRRVLERAGLDVELADDGELAWTALQRARAEGRPFDVLLTDVQMPNLDGLELTRRLRAAGETLPVVALTAHALPMHRQQCFDAGCNGYAPKPIDPGVLLGALAAALRSARSSSS